MDFLARIAALIFPWPLRALIAKPLSVQYRSMSDAQHSVAAWAYAFGQPHGFGETMRAIAWQESSFGADQDNPKDKHGGSYGIFGNGAKVVARRFRKEFPVGINEESRLRLVIFRLKSDREFAAKACLAELRYWYREHGEIWSRIWASYNAGWEWDSSDGRRYARQIKEKIKFLRTV